MLDIPGFVAEKNKLWGKSFILMVEICYADTGGGTGGTDPLYVRWFRSPKIGDTLTFEGLTWTAFGFSEPTRSQKSTGEIGAFDIALANAGRTMQSILENYMIEGRTGRLLIVHADRLANAASKLEERFIVKFADTTPVSASLTCASVRFNPMRSRIPKRLITRTDYPGVLGSRSRYY